MEVKKPLPSNCHWPLFIKLPQGWCTKAATHFNAFENTAKYTLCLILFVGESYYMS